MEMLHSVDRLKLDEQGIAKLKELRLGYAEAVQFYSKKELLDDWWQPHYTNTREYYERRLDAINSTIERKEVELRRTNASVQTASGVDKV